jgi:hypothetical protein
LLVRSVLICEYDRTSATAVYDADAMSGIETGLVVLGSIAAVALVVWLIMMVSRAIRWLRVAISRLRAGLRKAAGVAGEAFASGGLSFLVTEGERPKLPSYTERVLEAPRSFRVVIATAGLSLLVSREAPELEEVQEVPWSVL